MNENGSINEFGSPLKIAGIETKSDRNFLEMKNRQPTRKFFKTKKFETNEEPKREIIKSVGLANRKKKHVDPKRKLENRG